MTTSVGVDIIEIHRVAAVIERWQEKFLHRVYTEAELRYCRGRVPELAARFAGKEAITKALGTGIRGLAWREMEILPDPLGKPLDAARTGKTARGSHRLDPLRHLPLARPRLRRGHGG